MRFGVSYFGVRDPRHAARDLDEIVEAGFDTITHTLSEHDLRYHEEDVARLVEESQKRGLEVSLDPWGVAGLFGGEAYSELALNHLDSRQIDERGDSVPACCPNASATRDLLVRWTETAVRMRPDLLFWDEPHFYLGAYRESPTPPTCRCPACVDRWRAVGGGSELPPEESAELAEFRGASLARLLATAIDAAHSAAATAGVEVRHSLCLLPRGEFAGAGSDAWETFAGLDGLSRLATDPYWMDRAAEPSDYVKTHADPLRALCDRTGHEMEVWIQGIRIHRGAESAIVDAARAAAGAGAEIISFWSFRGTERMANLACDDPDAAWNAMKTAVREAASPARE